MHDDQDIKTKADRAELEDAASKFASVRVRAVKPA